VRNDWKGKLSPVLYCAGIAASFVNPWLAGAAYVFVALMRLAPDPRIERRLATDPRSRVERGRAPTS